MRCGRPARCDCLQLAVGLDSGGDGEERLISASLAPAAPEKSANNAPESASNIKYSGEGKGGAYVSVCV